MASSARLANVTKAKNTLILLANAKPKAAKKILANAKNHVIRAISEIALNCLNGVLPLTPAQKRKLRRYKKTMRDLNAPQTKLAAKRKIVQRGGFVSALLGVGVPLLIKGISSLVGIIKRKRAARKGRRK